MNPDETQISKLVNMNEPQCVMDEAKTTIRMILPEFDFNPLDKVFGDVKRLFRGDYPGYQACNTKFHDLKHTTDTFLALVRHVHGAVIAGQSFTERDINLGLACALLHDTGYIQETDDITGSGGKYTVVHINRSIEFMDRYFAANGYSREDFSDGRDILDCTGLCTEIKNREFRSSQIELMGKMLGSADLLGQMGDRTYLEKLVFLFHEFREGNVGEYENELNLLEKTFEFSLATKKRLANDLAGVNKYLQYHFKERWNINRDMYAKAMDDNINYLDMILKNHKEDFHLFLRRHKELMVRVN
jgi:hypothetical protein